jgi:acetoacetyl-CoA synthetase
MADSSADILWTPSTDSIARAQITSFALRPNIPGAARNPASSPTDRYAALHRWSVEEPGSFWHEIWDDSQVAGDPGRVDCRESTRFRKWQFFPEASLSFAENLLKEDLLPDRTFADQIAVRAYDERGECGTRTRKELADQVRQVAGFLLAKGVQEGDRVVAVLPNRIEAVVSMLAASAIGAVWSCCSPDFGDGALADRFSQIDPVVLISASEVQYNGKRLELMERMERLVSKLPTLRDWVVVGLPGRHTAHQPQRTAWDEILIGERFTDPFPRRAFQHPLAILYSSGTTGAPKCIVHGAGGTLLQHLKEHRLHCDLRPGDCMLYYTTTGWMMWNWLVSALAAGVTIVLYDGSPLAPDAGVLWRVVEQAGVTHMGASARYFAALQQQEYRPRDHHDLKSLRCLLSTGSPLLADQYRWLYRSVQSDMHLASISGGTDIVSCFVLGNPTLPVTAGQIQCAGLGMDVQVFDEAGRRVIGEPGELVDAIPFPSMPVGFWNDPTDTKYDAAYFEKFPGVWSHGDWCQQHVSGGFEIFGRSDAVLNPGGVRIGTAEIYQQLQGIPEILEGLATALRRDGDEQIVLFVRLADGQSLDTDLENRIRKRIREQCSPRHVPKHLVAAPDLPRTLNGKLSEIAARNALSGRPTGNSGALANPECLEFFRQWAQTIQ